MKISRLLPAFIAAVAVAVLLGCALHSQFVIAGLRGLGARIGGGTMLDVTLHDIAGMGPTYAMFIAAALLLGFLLTGFLWPRLKVPRTLAYAIGGGAAVGAMLLIMREALGVAVIAGARTPGGLLAQCAAGAAGGAVFALLSHRRGRSA